MEAESVPTEKRWVGVPNKPKKGKAFRELSEGIMNVDYENETERKNNSYNTEEVLYEEENELKTVIQII